MIDRRLREQIGGKGLNCGLRLGLFDAKHYLAVGDAVWLFGWLVGRQTTQRNGEGLVLRGKPLSYRDISGDTGFSERSLRRWMAVLVDGGYVHVKHSIYGRMVVRILNAKKFTGRQADLFDQHARRPMAKPIQVHPQNMRAVKSELRPVAVMPIKADPTRAELQRERDRQMADLRKRFPSEAAV